MIVKGRQVNSFRIACGEDLPERYAAKELESYLTRALFRPSPAFGHFVRICGSLPNTA